MTNELKKLFVSADNQHTSLLPKGLVTNTKVIQTIHELLFFSVIPLDKSRGLTLMWT